MQENVVKKCTDFILSYYAISYCNVMLLCNNVVRIEKVVYFVYIFRKIPQSNKIVEYNLVSMH